MSILAMTDCGPVVGSVVESLNVFKGIPYAQPPVGRLRFRPPEPHGPWREPRLTNTFGLSPMQPLEPRMGNVGAMGEDCLTLNVWAPAAPGPHPVLVWIYGGANMFGSSSQAMYDGAGFAKQGLVFVSVNYRLGAFGFLELGMLASSLSGSSVNGLADLAAALVWVHDNIHQFGGDPAAVSLMGQSAGAKNICALASSPAARGLFSRVAIQSGGGHSVYKSAEEAALVTQAFFRAAGLQPDELDRLVSMAAADVIAAQVELVKSWPQSFPFRPTLDSTFLPKSPIDAAAAGSTAHLSMIIGTCRDEAALFLPIAQAAHPFQARQLTNIDLTTMNAMEASYEAAFPSDPVAERRIRQLGAEEYWIPSLRMAEAHVRAGGKAWMYRFDRGATVGPLQGLAFHGSDTAFIFNAPWPELGLAPDQNLAPRIQRSWATWAREGKAVLEGGPSWPNYDLDRRKTLTIDVDAVVVDDPGADERMLWDDIM